MSAGLSAQQRARVDNLQIIVRDQTPFLPKVAFALITLASMGGAVFTGLGMGLSWPGIGVRWLTLWSIALAGGFVIWRLTYLRATEREVDDGAVAALNSSAFTLADRVARVAGLILIAGSPGALLVPGLAASPWLRYSLVGGSLIAGGALLLGVRRRVPALAAVLILAALLIGWAYADAGTGWPWLVRLAHLAAFTLWLGGAQWNIAVAMPAGRQHPNVDAVLTGARQLDRFRWVVRCALPTIIITGFIMASGFGEQPTSWWLTFPGILIPLKILTIVALVVVFITCPLFRHCSPVQGVCNVEDLDEARP